MVDQLKGPMNNKPKPDSISRASNNYYFGQNLNHANNGNKGTIFRAAYAVGSGNRSIGLNPKTFVINQIFPDLATLVAEITKVIRQKTEWKNACFNQVSVKLYYTFLTRKVDPYANSLTGMSTLPPIVKLESPKAITHKRQERQWRF